MSDRLAELGETTDVVLVTFTDPENLETYSYGDDVAFPILTDPTRASYRAFGLGRGSVARVYGVKMMRRYVEIFRESGLAGLRKPTEDTLQLGGDFVVGPDGKLVYGFWGEGPDDRPSVDELVDAVRAAKQ